MPQAEADDQPGRLRIVWRHRQPGEGIDHELLWFVVGVAAVAMGLAWLMIGLPLPACQFRQATGLPCASCGTTRALVSLTKGQFGAAFAWNPLATLASLAAAAALAYSGAVVIFRLPRLRVVGFSARHRKLLLWSIVLLLAANWAYVLAMQ